MGMAAASEACVATLSRLLAQSLAQGHWRVACRRYLMLQACADAVSLEWRSRCERLLQRCSDRDLQRMQADAARWAAMLAAERVTAPAGGPP